MIPTNYVLSGALLLIFTLLSFLYHWRRRHLYKSAKQIKSSVKGWPIVGSLPLFRGDESLIFSKIYEISMNCQDITKIWLGNRLMYVLIKPEYVEKVLNNNKSLEKPALYTDSLRSLFGNGLIAAPVHTWKKNRKFIAPTLHPKTLESFMDTFNEKTENLLKKLHSKVGKTIDIFEPIAMCTSIISIATSMGVEISEIDITFIEKLDTALSLGILRPFNLLYKYDFLFKYFQIGKKYFEACKYCDDFTKKVVKDRRKNYEEENNENICQTEKQRHIFLDQLIHLSSTGEKISNEDLKDETKTLIVAATDTSAATVAFFLLFMGMNPEIQDKVYDEIMEVLGPDRHVTPTDLSTLKYLDRTIKETLRICPPVPLVIRSVDEDISLGDGISMARGTNAAIPIIGIHRNSKLWPDPFKFDPDRFLPEERTKRHPLCFLPFSAGPRNCIGQIYGIMVTKTIIVHLIRKYKFSTPIKSIEDMKFKYSVTMKPLDGTLVSFVTRQ